MPRAVRLRRWQRAALDALAAAPGPDFLAVATPGAGKTTFALTAAALHLAEHPQARVVVVAPTQHLKAQWAEAAARVDLHLDPDWRPALGGLAADVHGLVTTYQQVATAAAALAPLAQDAFVVLDEVHHAGDERAWGVGLQRALGGAARRLSLSGTPFRSDTRAIPFVRYHLDEARPDHEYGYGDALAEGRVVRPAHFPRLNGEMEWTAPDGALHRATFDDPLDAARANQRLRTALSLEGEWLPAVLGRADARLRDLRRTDPDAGGLAIALDREHARGIADLLRRRFRADAVVATSDDPAASARIAAFRTATTPWIVAVRMVSEGVDIPRLRVGVFATTTTTELFFRQAVGRLVRWEPGGGPQPAYLYIPDDPRLRTHAVHVAEQRRHSLRRPDEDGTTPARPEPDPAALDEPADHLEPQLSLFAALSAVPMGDDTVDDGAGAPAGPPTGLGDGAPVGIGADDLADDPALLVNLAVPPRPGGRAAGGDARAATRGDAKRLLRDANAELVRDLARGTGLEHRHLNAELNRAAGIRRIAEATVEQLERRRRHAERWLSTL